MFRVPGSVNHKDPENPVPVRCFAGDGKPMTVEQITAALDAAGIPEEPETEREEPPRGERKPKDDTPPLQAVTAAMTPGKPSPKVRARLAQALTDVAVETDRHHKTLDHVLALLRYGYDGESGVAEALEALYRAFVFTVASDRLGGQDEAVKEFGAFVAGAEELLAADPPRAQRREDEATDTGDDIRHSAHLGMAVKLAEMFEGELLYVNRVGWHSWDGQRWAPDEDGAARRAVHALIRRDREIVLSIRLETEERDKRLRQIARYETASAISGILTEAAALQAFSVTVENLDADPWLFNCANGTLDLRTMVQRPHDPADRISKVANAAYRADTSGTLWAD